MIVCLALYLHSLYLVALGQNIPNSGPSSFVPDSEGDLLFLLDSSGSVTEQEFMKVKAFIGDLLGPFTFGPRDVQASVVHIGTEPSLEFTFDKHGSSQEVQKAIKGIKQRKGDTNTGKALSYVKENLLAGTFGSRSDVPQVMVWVTDGLSSDDISQPMKLLKDLGVTVFIVSTGQGNYLELSEAASQPSETHLHFVDVEALPIITKELRDSIIDLIRAKRLHAHDITTTSFRLAWPKLLTHVGEESYLLEYSLESGRRTQKALSADQTGMLVSNLTPNTTYWVTLTPESNVQYFQPQTIQVTTLPEPIQEISLYVHDITTTSFRLTWPNLLNPDKGERYLLEYSLDSDRSGINREILSGGQTEITLRNLSPDTTYRVTLTPKSNVRLIRPQTIQVSTLPEPIQEISLYVHDITTTSFRLTWPNLLNPDKGERYLLEYSLDSDRSGINREILSGGQTEITLRNLSPNTTYRVTLTPKSNVRLIRPQTIQVSTLPEPIQEISLYVHDITTTNFRLTWPNLLNPDKGERYLLEYSLDSDRSGINREILSGGQTEITLRNLSPNTTYRVTLTPKSNVRLIRPQTIQVSTLPEPIQEISLYVHDITTTSFRLTWPNLLNPDKGERYLLEYSLDSDRSRVSRENVPGGQTEIILRNLSPDTTYRVTLTPKSNVRLIRPQTIQVSTLPEPIQDTSLRAHDVTATSFRLTWAKLLSVVKDEVYVLEYSMESAIPGRVREILPGDQTSMVLSNLSPNTTYRVTLTPKSNLLSFRPQSIHVLTLSEPIQEIPVRVSDITTSSFRLTWPPLLSPVNEDIYLLEYSPESDLKRTTRKNLPGAQTSVILDSLSPNTIYQVTLTPKSNVRYIQPKTLLVSTLPEPIPELYLRPFDITSTSFRLSWPPLMSFQERYILEYSLESNVRRSLQRSLPGSQTEVLLKNLTPNTRYRVTLIPESNVLAIRPKTIQVSTLAEQIGLSQILISEPTSNSFRVSWGPHLDSVAGYEIQYGPLPSNTVYKVLQDSTVNSTTLENLNPNTTYLVTITARFKDGREKGFSAIACTEENDVKVTYLRLEDLGYDRIKATWGSADGNVKGYRVRCRRHAEKTSVVNLAPQTHSTVFKDVTPGSINKICVKPIYKDRTGKDLCRRFHTHPVTPTEGYSRVRT